MQDNYLYFLGRQMQSHWILSISSAIDKLSLLYGTYSLVLLFSTGT